MDATIKNKKRKIVKAIKIDERKNKCFSEIIKLVYFQLQVTSYFKKNLLIPVKALEYENV